MPILYQTFKKVYLKIYFLKIIIGQIEIIVKYEKDFLKDKSRALV